MTLLRLHEIELQGLGVTSIIDGMIPLGLATAIVKSPSHEGISHT